MGSEVTGALAALGAECYLLQVKAPVELMYALVQATSWMKDAARVRDVDDQERGMATRWDAYRELEVRDGASRPSLQRAEKRIEERERVVASTRLL